MEMLVGRGQGEDLSEEVTFFKNADELDAYMKSLEEQSTCRLETSRRRSGGCQDSG